MKISGDIMEKKSEYGQDSISDEMAQVFYTGGEKVMTDIKYDIVEEIGVLSENTKGWRKEINLISWNGAAPKYDIREWAPEHEKMGKGTTLTKDEVMKLKKILEVLN